MRIFVTGGTGFIGSHFLEHALREGHQVTALCRPGSKPVIPLTCEPVWLEKSLDEVTSEQLKGHDSLVHFAAQGVSPQITDWNTAFDVNVRQSLSLFANAVAAEIPHLIACGSCFEYGKSGEFYEFIPPDAPLMPIGPYAASKAAFSLAVEAMARTSSASFTIIRPFHLFGEGQHESNLWPSLRLAALSGSNFPMTGGEQIRDYMSVEEAAGRFFEYALSSPLQKTCQVINIGSGQPVSLKDFISSWWQKWNASGQLGIGEIPYRTGEVMRFVPLISKNP
jgi:nucleoside-diphosphate-sugar epimerase